MINIDVPEGDAATEGIVQSALDRLAVRAAETHSDSLVVLKDGKLIGEWYFGHDKQPINTKAMTKSIVSLAIGCLIDDGKIKSLDQPVLDFYPQWNQGYKKFITVGHLLAQVSGIDPSEEFNTPDLVQLALASELKDKAGTRFANNNKAVNLLSGVIQVASGKPMEQYISERIFSPLGITDASWEHDQAGNAEVMSGLSLTAIDLSKIGQMMLNGGIWQGQKIVSSDWIVKSTNTGVSANPWYGLLWWLLFDKVSLHVPTADEAQYFHMSPQLVQTIRSLHGKQFEAKNLDRDCKQAMGGDLFRQWSAAMQDGFRAIAKEPPPIGFKAEGFMGQNLIVLTQPQLVVVRQISKENYKSADDDFPDLVDCVKALTVKQ